MEKKKRRREENERKKRLALGPMGKWSLDQRTLNVDFESGRCSCGLLLPAQQLIQDFVMLLWMIVDCFSMCR